jgi:hypothetical protein
MLIIHDNINLDMEVLLMFKANYELKKCYDFISYYIEPKSPRKRGK